VRSVLLPRHQRTLHNAVLWVQGLIFQIRLIALAPRFDRLVMYRLPVSGWARWLLRSRRAEIVADFDDALDTIDADRAELLGGLKRWILKRGLHNAIRAASTTVTSNDHNRAIVEQLNRRAVVIPTSVDLTRLSFRDRGAPVEVVPVIGWIGSPSTAAYLVGIEDALHEVVRRHRAVIRLIGAGRSPFRALPVEMVAWSYERESDDLRGIDIGLMPMPDTPWTRGKAATKALQYGGSGAPTVASWTNTNVGILGENDGTLFARSSEEWVVQLCRLLGDAPLRGELGRRGRARVERLFSVEGNAGARARVIRHPLGPTT
jgi:glycosyltransferase involved in cell wall biosynthesis